MEEEDGEEIGRLAEKKGEKEARGTSRGLSDRITGIHLSIFTSYKRGAREIWRKGVKAAEGIISSA